MRDVRVNEDKHSVESWRERELRLDGKGWGRDAGGIVRRVRSKRLLDSQF